MLIEFTLGNFRSFRAKTSLSLLATQLKSADKQLDVENVFNSPGGVPLLRSAALYGANGSGKSNVVRGLSLLRSIVLNSSRETQATAEISVEPFLLSTKSELEPTTLEVVFVAEGTQYRYGFEATKARIISEWLFHVPSKRERALFRREGDSYTIAAGFKEGRGLEQKTRANALFLSVCAQFNGKIATRAQRWIGALTVISGLHDVLHRGLAIAQLGDPESRNRLLRTLRALDLGFDDVSTRKIPFADSFPKDLSADLREAFKGAPDVVAVQTTHRKVDDNEKPVGVALFDLERHESDGTQKLFALAGAVTHALGAGRVLIVDELDGRLHPLITCALIQLFNSAESNPSNAQLVFTTHDTNLLSHRLLRRDQIWFVEKNELGGSSLYSLAEFKVRKDARFENDYVLGRYGAIPFVGDLESVLGRTVHVDG